MKIAFWYADEQACGHYRMKYPAAALRAAGHDVRVTQTMSAADAVEQDVTVCQRIVTRDAADMMELAAAEGATLVYEADDLLWGLDVSNPAYPLFGAPSVQANMDRAVRACRAVTVSTEPLADEFLQRYPDKDVHVLPNRVPDHMLTMEQLRHDEPVQRVLWAGSPTHARDMVNDVRYGLRRAMQTDLVRFTSMGADYRKQLKVPGAYVPWDEDLREFHYSLRSYDIGLAPLEPTRFNASKSGLKALEYQAAGVVPVCSRSKAYDGIVTDGHDGFLCGTSAQWQTALRSLVHDEDLREEMRGRGLAHTASRTYGANVDWWANAYAEILER